jgi:phage gp36-like protein
MAYCTLDDLKLLISERTLLQLCDDDSDGEFVAAPPNHAWRVLTQAIEEADATIDSYISGRYDTPLGTVPVAVRQMSANLTVVTLFARRTEMEVPEGIAAREKKYRTWLEDIRSEKASLPGIDKRPPAVFQVSKTDDDILFNDNLLRRY